MRNGSLFFTTIAFCFGFLLGALFLGYRSETKTGQVTVPTKVITPGQEDVTDILFPDGLKALETRHTILFDPLMMCLGGLSVGCMLGAGAFILKESYPKITYRKILSSVWCRNIIWIVLFTITWLAVLIAGQLIIFFSVEVNPRNVMFRWRNVVLLFSVVTPVIFIGGRIHFSESLKSINEFMSIGILMFLKGNHIRQFPKKILWWTFVFVAFTLLCPPWVGYKSHGVSPSGEAIHKSRPVFVGFHYIMSAPDPDFAFVEEIDHHLKNKVIFALLVLSVILLTVEYLVSKLISKLRLGHTQTKQCPVQFF